MPGPAHSLDCKVGNVRQHTDSRYFVFQPILNQYFTKLDRPNRFVSNILGILKGRGVPGIQAFALTQLGASVTLRASRGQAVRELRKINGRVTNQGDFRWPVSAANAALP